MNFLPQISGFSVRALLALTALALGACSTIEPGAPVAAVSVQARSSFEIKEVVERVFNEAGYRTSGRTFETITFDREADRMNTVTYGNWIGGEVAERARVAVVEKSDGVYRVRCTPLIVRDPSDVAFEDEHRRMQLFSPHYSRLLRSVKREFATPRPES